MAYRGKNDLKGERKLGREAVRKMMEAPNYDPQRTLALAQSNLDAFRKLDDMDDINFVAYIRKFRDEYPDIYPIFWWWRFAEEDVGKDKEDDCKTNSTRYRSFMVTPKRASLLS